MDDLEHSIVGLDKSLTYAGRPATMLPPDAESIRAGQLTANAVQYILFEAALNNPCTGAPYTVFPADFYPRLVDNRPKPSLSELPEFVQNSLALCDFPRLQEPDLLSVFDRKFTLIPVHVSNHWMLFVFYSAVQKAPSTGHDSCLFLFDSGTCELAEEETSDVANNIRAFLNCVWFFSKHKDHGHAIREFSELSCPMVTMNVPQARNTDDCGVHLIYAARVVMANLPGFYGHCKVHDRDMFACSNFFAAKIRVGVDARSELLKMLLPAGRKRTKRVLLDL